MLPLDVGIDHVFVSRAVVEHATTYEWGRPALCIERERRARGGTSNHGSWGKNVINFLSTTII